jgi:DNA repair protein RecO (recombination protein O)
MPLVTDRAVVLQSFPYSETSKILRVLTAEHGLHSLLAKGAQRPKSRFGGLLEPFTEGTASFFAKEGRDLHTLSGWDLLRNRQALGRDLIGFAGASLLAELVLRFGAEDEDRRLFAGVTAALDAVIRAEATQREAAVIAAAWRIVVLLGFTPQTDTCIACGTTLQASDAARFDPGGGGVTCVGCRPGRRTLDPDSRSELRVMLDAAVATPTFRNPRVHRDLLRVFLQHQLAQERPLRSLDFFDEQLAGGELAHSVHRSG